MSEPTTKTVAEEALEVAQWLGTGQALLARLQETYGEFCVGVDAGVLTEGQKHRDSRFIGQLIRETVEHFGRMP